MRTILASCLLLAAALNADSVQNDLPPRLQWDANGGYCGEVSVITAGLYFGQYMSQYTARDIALKGYPQTSSELLLGINDSYAATQMRLQATEWDTVAEQNTDDFLVWVKQQVVQGNPVAIGLYMNQSIFHPNTGRVGDSDYDHIVTAYQIDSTHLNDAVYDPNDILYFSDHGLYKEDGEHRPYLFHETFGNIQKSRDEANLLSSPIYSLSNDASNYGLVVQSVIGDTAPVRVKTDVNSELPAMTNKLNSPPLPGPIVLTVSLSGLDPQKTYNLYRYSDINAVPTSEFNAQAHKAARHWNIAGQSSYTMTETIQSNEVAVYRAVKTTDP